MHALHKDSIQHPKYKLKLNNLIKNTVLLLMSLRKIRDSCVFFYLVIDAMLILNKQEVGLGPTMKIFSKLRKL